MGQPQISSMAAEPNRDGCDQDSYEQVDKPLVDYGQLGDQIKIKRRNKSVG